VAAVGAVVDGAFVPAVATAGAAAIVLLAGGLLVDGLDVPPDPAIDLAGVVVLDAGVPAVSVVVAELGVELESLPHPNVLNVAMHSALRQLFLRTVMSVSLVRRAEAGNCVVLAARIAHGAVAEMLAPTRREPPDASCKVSLARIHCAQIVIGRSPEFFCGPLPGRHRPQLTRRMKLRSVCQG
jgi:hypothetical protein